MIILLKNFSYYLEAVASKNGGLLSLDINAKILNTDLTDKLSSNIQNEIQEIDINSTVSLESFVSYIYFYFLYIFFNFF